jgi:DNA transformation protein
MADKDAVMARLLATLVPLGAAQEKAMFGGFGIFMNGEMFAKILPKGVVALKADAENFPLFEAAGMPRAGKMPYYDVKAADLNDAKKMLAWAGSSIEAAARQPKKSKKNRSRQ